MALQVKKSRIPQSGNGLFTNKKIKKESKIIEYRGEIIGYNEHRKRAKNNEDHYLLYLKRTLCIDAKNTPQYKARYANDAKGFARVNGIHNNSEYVIYGNKCYIVATRDIYPGEEILVNYTKSYWDTIRKRSK